MSRLLRVLLFSGFLAAIFNACQNSEQRRKLINLRLDDSLGVSNYDSLRVEILNSNDSVLGKLFSGPYRPDSSHMLSNLVLPEGVPANYTLRITVYKSGVILLEIELTINQELASRPVITYRGFLDSIPPAAPGLVAASPVKSPVWTWSPTESRTSYHVLLTRNGTTFDSANSTLTQYSPDTSLRLTDGIWILKVVAIDSVGNRSLPSTRPIFVDNTIPKFISLQPGVYGRVTAIDPIVSGIALDTSGIKALKYRVNNGALDSLPQPTSSWVLPRLVLAAGQSSLSITAFDSAGNSVESTLTIYKWPNVIFVCEGGNGSGDSWQDCSGNLDSALSGPRVRQSGFQAWITSGSYPYPDFFLSNSGTVTKGGIFGGFTKSSVRFSDRNPRVQISYLFGDSTHGTPSGINDDFTVDGFVTDGALPLLDASYISGNLRIQNCDIRYSTGPQIKVHYNPVAGSLFLTNCRFLDNFSSSQIVSLISMDEVYIDSCLFQGNRIGDSTAVLKIESKVLSIKNSKFYDVAPTSSFQIVYDAPADYRRFEIIGCEIRGGRNAISTPVSSYIYSGNIEL